MYGGYVRFNRIQCLGGDPARLQFDRLTREQVSRLKEPLTHIRMEWARFQMMPYVGGTGRSIHQMAGAALHHVDVDGDCFLLNRMSRNRRVWDLLPGDALEEGQFRVSGNGNRQLGVETDGHGLPVRYYFRHNGMIAPLNIEYSFFRLSRRKRYGDSRQSASSTSETCPERLRLFADGPAARQSLRTLPGSMSGIRRSFVVRSRGRRLALP